MVKVACDLCHEKKLKCTGTVEHVNSRAAYVQPRVSQIQIGMAQLDSLQRVVSLRYRLRYLVP
jgi:hypothetical protein